MKDALSIKDERGKRAMNLELAAFRNSKLAPRPRHQLAAHPERAGVCRGDRQRIPNPFPGDQNFALIGSGRREQDPS